MAETIKVNFALLPETVERLEEICRLTFRAKSDVIDWLVSEKWREMERETKQAEVEHAEP